MKKLVIVALAVFVGMFSWAKLSVADENPIYVGFGFVQIGDPSETNITSIEAGLLANTTNRPNREVTTKRLVKDIFLGYRLPNNWGVELGHMWGDVGARSEVTGTNRWVDFAGNPASTATTYNQKSTVSAWHLSFIKQLPLNENVKVFGRAGITRTHNEWEQRWMHVSSCTTCINDGTYQAKTKVTDKTSGLFGLGLSANVYKNVDIRMEATKRSSLWEPKVSAVYSY